MEKLLYFGYGSNLWKDQMNRRCPNNKFIGVAELKGWKWIISSYSANIIQSPDDVVYGFLYQLTRQDEEELDRYEHAYEKRDLRVNLISSKDSHVEGPIEPVMVYIDFERVEIGKAREEYIHRINKAIEDGIKEGISRKYFEQYFRPFIPPPTM